MRLFRCILVVLGVLLGLFGAHRVAVSWLGETTEATITGIQRDPASQWGENNYLVTYTFRTGAKQAVYGTYLLEDPQTLGDMPRKGSDLEVIYSALDPTVNYPWRTSLVDNDQLFYAELAFTLAIILFLAGLKLRM